MSHTFSHKLLLMIAAGFAAACLFWVFRHFVEQALWETSDAGWKESLNHKSTPYR
jgi:hypothetical protein